MSLPIRATNGPPADLSDQRDPRSLCRVWPDKQMARAMENQAALLLRGLGNRILALVTASQIASASAISFFCRLTKGTKNRKELRIVGYNNVWDAYPRCT